MADVVTPGNMAATAAAVVRTYRLFLFELERGGVITPSDTTRPARLKSRLSPHATSDEATRRYSESGADSADL